MKPATPKEEKKEEKKAVKEEKKAEAPKEEKKAPKEEKKAAKEEKTEAPAAADSKKKEKPKAEPKAEDKKEEAKKDAAAPVEPVDKESLYADFRKASLRVARILSIQDHPAAEKLYLCQVDIGLDAPRQLIAGLRGRVPMDKLKDSLIVTITNLKPAKLVGLMSDVMLLAATHPDDHNNVEALIPPAGSKPGDVVYLQGRAPSAEAEIAKTLSSKIWGRVVENLAVYNHEARVADLALATDKGACSSTLPDKSTIH